MAPKLAPKKSIAKKKSHAGKKAPRKAGSALYSLFLQKADGAEAHFWVFDGTDAVVETIGAGALSISWISSRAIGPCSTHGTAGRTRTM